MIRDREEKRFEYAYDAVINKFSKPEILDEFIGKKSKKSNEEIVKDSQKIINKFTRKKVD